MAGQIKLLLDNLITRTAKGNVVLANFTKTKLILRGIDPAKYTASSPDDPAVIQKLKDVAKELEG